jgi:hypothetical protein
MKTFVSAISILLALSIVTDAEAAKTKKKYKRADFSKEEQAKIYERALTLCRKQHGDRLHRAEVDYVKKQFVCWAY